MRSTRRRSSISHSRRSSLRTRPRLKTSEYSHIIIQPALEKDHNKGEVSAEDDFICKRSAQLDIQDGSFAADLLTKTPDRPRTFAEATMSTGPGDQLHGSSTADDGLGVLPSSQFRLESLGTFRYTFKKKKKPVKWSPFDLATPTDTGSELGSMSSDVDSRPVSPTHEPLPARHHNLSTSIAAIPGKGTVLVVNAAVVDTDPTPTQPRFDFPSHNYGDNTADFQDFSDVFDPELSDTQSTKDRTEVALAAMARSFGREANLFKPGDDPFDSMEWSASLPPASSPDKSPPRIVRKPQPVAYTTVGSVVDPTVVPQFTAPNRIQREGSSRRPLLMPLHNRQEPYPRGGAAPSLGLHNPMQYSQSQTHSPGSFTSSQQPLSARSSRSSRWKQQQLALTDIEKQVLARQGMSSPQMLPENIQPSPGTPTFVNRPHMRIGATTLQAPRIFGTKESQDLDENSNNHGPVQGLEKMQTLQRLAKFDNPMQELARTRLSEFSVGNTRPRSSVLNGPPPTNLSFEALLRERKKSIPPKIETQPGSSLNRGYQFPRPDSARPTTTFLNPLFRASSPSNSHSSTSSRPPPSTYPVPLTAGPPGQRQYLATRTSQNAAYLDNLRAMENRSSAYNSLGTDPSTSPWPKPYQAAAQAPVTQMNYASLFDTVDGTKCLDTLPMSEVSIYYPKGFPKDMTGQYLPLPLELQKQMGQLANDSNGSKNMKKAKRKQELDKWFYSGQKRFYMSAEDHLGEAANRQHAINPFGPIGPPPKTSSISTASEPCSIDDMNKMSTAMAAAPLLDALLGSLLAYVDKTSASRTYQSNYVSSPAWQIDASEKGNGSFFGEDWGAPPKRIGRDPRYQPFVPGEGFWE